TITLPAGAVTDQVGNPTTTDATADEAVTLSPVPPTVSLSTTVTSFPTNLSAVPITVFFSAPVTGFNAGKLIVDNGTVANFTANPDGRTYTFDLAHVADGPFSVTVPAGAGVEALGTPSLGATPLTGSFDTTPPADGRTFTFNLFRTADGGFSLTVPAGGVTDAVGNPSGSALLAGTFDTTPPTAAITTPVGLPTNAASIEVTITFSEPGVAFFP